MKLTEEVKKAKQKMKERIALLGNGKRTKAKIDNFDKQDAQQIHEAIGQSRENGTSLLAQAMSNHFLDSRDIYLNNKVDDYINWYYENMVKGHYTDMGEFWQLIDMRNFIEKMAVWYELRYPDYEINRLMPGSGQEAIEINNIMFNDNSYINALLDKDAETRELDWSEFYNTRAFIRSLPWSERYMFTDPKYRRLVYIRSLGTGAHFHLTSDGFIDEAEYIDAYSNSKITEEEIKGMHITEVIELLKERGVELPENNELELAVTEVENWIKQGSGMLDCVMYRIIERGGNRIGPRRALLFAKEFERNIDIPMMYGIDYSDPGLRKFINEYIKLGGSKDLVCYIDYFSRTNDRKRLNTVTIEELLRTRSNNCATKYTPEETELHQKLVDTLASQVNQKELVKQQRIQRKLVKSRKRPTSNY